MNPEPACQDRLREWNSVRDGIERSLRSRFRRRLSVAGALHPWLLTTAGRTILSFVAGLGCLPDIEPVFDLSAAQLNELFEKEAPKLAAGALDKALNRAGLKAQDLDALESVLPFPLDETRTILRRHGNISSPSVMFTLEERMNAGNDADTKLWLLSFGAGFAAHSCELNRPS